MKRAGEFSLAGDVIRARRLGQTLPVGCEPSPGKGISAAEMDRRLTEVVARDRERTGTTEPTMEVRVDPSVVKTDLPEKRRKRHSTSFRGMRLSGKEQLD